MKIGFIGCGNMAKAIIEGLLEKRAVSSENILVSARNMEKLKEYAKEKHLSVSDTNARIVKECDVIVFAIKPQQLTQVINEIKPEVNENRLFISILAAKDLATFEKELGQVKVIRMMPNLNAAIHLSASALCFNEHCSESDIQTAKTIFETIGKVYLIEEKEFSAFSASVCCSPAFSFLYIQSLIDAAIEDGLSAHTAKEAVIESVIGSALTLKHYDYDAADLVKKVCSPGGTTIEGVNLLRENNFSKTVCDAVHASFYKDKHFSQ